MIRIYILLCIVLLPNAANAEIFKCKNNQGQVEFKDTPCDMQSETVFVKEYHGNINFSETLAKIVESKLKSKASKDPEVRELLEVMTKVESFKIYYFSQITPAMIDGCKKVSEPAAKRLSKTLEVYNRSMSDYLAIGKSLTKTGFYVTKPIKKRRSSSEMKADIDSKIKKVVRKFKRVSGNNVRNLIKECSDFRNALSLLMKKV